MSAIGVPTAGRTTGPAGWGQAAGIGPGAGAPAGHPAGIWCLPRTYSMELARVWFHSVRDSMTASVESESRLAARRSKRPLECAALTARGGPNTNAVAAAEIAHGDACRWIPRPNIPA